MGKIYTKNQIAEFASWGLSEEGLHYAEKMTADKNEKASKWLDEELICLTPWRTWKKFQMPCAIYKNNSNGGLGNHEGTIGPILASYGYKSFCLL